MQALREKKIKPGTSQVITVSASMVDPSLSLTAAACPSEPASKFSIEAPWYTIKHINNTSAYASIVWNVDQTSD